MPPTFPWVREYYEGLLKSFDVRKDFSRLDNGMNNDFLSMGRSVMGALRQASPLDDISLFLMAHQTPDTYFPFRSTTTRLCREFNISAPAIGMTEQELTTPYIALTALLAAFRQGRRSGSGLLLVLDQGTLPYERTGYPTTVTDNALVVKLGSAQGPDSIAVNGRKYWIDPATRKAGWITQCIYAFLDEQRIDMQDLHIVVDEQTRLDASADMRAPTTLADASLMSASGLATALGLIDQGKPNVLLAHLSKDEHLFLFSFSKPASSRGNA